jgi:hypothetical protein
LNIQSFSGVIPWTFVNGGRKIKGREKEVGKQRRKTERKRDDRRNGGIRKKRDEERRENGRERGQTGFSSVADVT